MGATLIVGLVTYAIVYFLVSNGFAGEVAKIVVMPILSLVLLIYFVANWTSTAKGIHNEGNSQLAKAGGLSIGVIIGLALVVPLGAGVFLDGVVGSNINELKTWSEEHAFFSAWLNFVYLFISIGVVIGLVFPLLKKRMDLVTPQTEVSEFRANMQESVHPNEIFINIEVLIRLVMIHGVILLLTTTFSDRVES